MASCLANANANANSFIASEVASGNEPRPLPLALLSGALRVSPTAVHIAQLIAATWIILLAGASLALALNLVLDLVSASRRSVTCSCHRWCLY